MSSIRLSSPSPEVTSLSAAQVDLLEQTLRQHRQLLESAHRDARRLARYGQRPAYLIDFELLFRYMFEAEKYPESHQELEYLYTHTDTLFISGPGTSAEVDRLLAAVSRAAGHRLASARDLRALDLSAPGDLRVYGVDGDTLQVGIFRLFELLHSPNFVQYATLVDPVQVDDVAYETRKAALEKDRRRRKSTPEANQADAINWAAVLHLRRVAPDLDFRFYPYLLTSTQPLLDERNWGDESGVPVSRNPREAIYPEVLFDIFPDPPEALHHTIKALFEAASLLRDLQNSPAYLDPDSYSEEEDWEQAVEDERLSEGLRRQLDELAEFVSDPVIYETQRIYDNAQLAAENFVQQRGELAQSLQESPRKLFDLIVGITEAIRVSKDGSAGLGNLWSTVLDVRTEPNDEFTAFEVVERGSAGDALQYFAVERYCSKPDVSDPSPLYVLRWPSSANAERVVELFVQAFRDQDIGTVDVFVGSPQGIQSLEADLPVTLSELVAAVQPGVSELVDALRPSAESEPPATEPMEAVSEVFPDIGDARETPTEITWIRMNSEPVDLYADLFMRATRDPVIGVFTRAVNIEHVAELYAATSARYLFPAWFSEALRSVVMT
jgi:hypothetical protein